ncbi:LysR family transcriptional regulator [Oribacterium sp. HCP28S3_H8]|uniref:LysR family transcriptional regulator n=1 Tax=Oribacterium sp. HCP28S3_H8 TaxID=3438945 RepID=UPI003F8983FE
MDLNKFNYLKMLMEEQNVTKAAKRLYISQPALTDYLNHLEEDLGFHVFNRKSNPVKITREGRKYIEKMDQLLSEEQVLIDQCRKEAMQKSEFSYGIGQISSEINTPYLVKELLNLHPFLNINVHENTEKNIMKELKQDKIDVMFGHINLDTVNYVFEELGEQKLILMIPENLLDPYAFYPENKTIHSASKNHPQKLLFANTDVQHPIEITPGLLSNMPIIEPARSQGFYLSLKTLISNYHVHPIRTIRTANMRSAISMVKSGIGYMYASPDLLSLDQDEPTQKIIFATLPRLTMSRKYYAIYKNDNPNITYIREAIKIMKERNIFAYKSY